MLRDIKESKIPKNPPNFQLQGEFQVKTKMSNNFCTERDKQNISTDHLCKNGVATSYSDSTLPSDRNHFHSGFEKPQKPQ
jgi:uncharacterized protein (UPF0305 family)